MNFLRIPKGYWYVASPYSKYPGGVEEAFKAACECTGRLLARGIPVFSPIAHSHPIAQHAAIDPMSHEIWLEADRPMMEAAHGALVLRLPGWEFSYGVKHEIDFFRDAQRPIHLLDPYSL